MKRVECRRSRRGRSPCSNRTGTCAGGCCGAERTGATALVGKYTHMVYEAVKAGKVRVVGYFDFFGCFNSTKTCP